MDTPQKKVSQEGEERGVEAIDWRKVGQQSKRHACEGQIGAGSGTWWLSLWVQGGRERHRGRLLARTG